MADSRKPQTIRFLWYNANMLHGVDISLRNILGFLTIVTPENIRQFANTLFLKDIFQKKRILGCFCFDFQWFRSFLVGDVPVRMGAKPQVEARIFELSERLYASIEENYEIPAILAFCELFGTPDEIRERLNFISYNTINMAYGPGAGPRGIPIDSGLITLTFNLPVLRVEKQPFDDVFAARGHPIRDPDYWANKGILLTEVGTEYGNLEVYTTHLYAGETFGDIIFTFVINYFQGKSITKTKLFDSLSNRAAEFVGVSDQQKKVIQNYQLDSLITFIQRHHNPSNLVIIAGDFNINAGRSDLYKWFNEHLEKLSSIGIDLDDIWLTSFRDTIDVPDTTVIDPLRLFSGRSDSSNGRPRYEHQRIDYIFIQRPTAMHRFNVAINHAAIVEFPRANVAQNDMQYLSDHLGMELVLDIRPID